MRDFGALLLHFAGRRCRGVGPSRLTDGSPPSVLPSSIRHGGRLDFLDRQGHPTSASLASLSPRGVPDQDDAGQVALVPTAE